VPSFKNVSRDSDHAHLVAVDPKLISDTGYLGRHFEGYSFIRSKDLNEDPKYRNVGEHRQ